MESITAERRKRSLRDERSVRAYGAPLVVFGVLTMLEQVLPPGLYPAFYVVKIATVTATLVYFRGPLGDIRPSLAVVPLAAVVGLVVLAEWLLTDKLVPYPHLGSRA